LKVENKSITVAIKIVQTISSLAVLGWLIGGKLLFL
jgi:hypothetical protein